MFRLHRHEMVCCGCGFIAMRLCERPGQLCQAPGAFGLLEYGAKLAGVSHDAGQAIGAAATERGAALS